MKLRKFQEISLMTRMDLPFCCDWSDDGSFFVVVENGIEILRLNPNPKNLFATLHLQRTFLYPLVNYPTENAGFDVDQILPLLPREGVFQVLCNPILAPRLKGFADMPVIFVKALWSPGGLAPGYSCILALLTNTGCITLWQFKSLKWTIIADISNFVTIHLKNELQLEEMKVDLKHIVDELKTRSDKLSTSSMAWSELYRLSDRNISFLASVQKCGRIYIWKITSDDAVDTHITIELDKVIETDFKYASATHWKKISENSIVIVLGSSSGDVRCIHLYITDNLVSDVLNTVVLWPDKDKLRVTHVTSVPHGDDICIVVVKGSHFITLTINKDSELQSTIYKDLGNISITGMTYLNGSFMVPTQTGQVFNVTLKRDGEQIKIESELIESDLEFTKWAHGGICVSRSGAICVSCLRPCRPMEKIAGCSYSMVMLSHFEGFDPVKALLSNESRLLTHRWDLIEVARILGRNNPNVMHDWQIDLPEHPSQYELKLYYWLQTIREGSKREPASLLHLYRRIILEHVKSYLKNIIDDHRDFNEFDRKAINMHLKYLKHHNNVAPDEEMSLLMEQLSNINLNAIISDRCEWCDEELEDILCSASHPRQFCCITLLHTPDRDALLCKLCSAGCHPKMFSRRPICTFCDTPFEHRGILNNGIEDSAEEILKLDVVQDNAHIQLDESVLMTLANPKIEMRS